MLLGRAIITGTNINHTLFAEDKEVEVLLAFCD